MKFIFCLFSLLLLFSCGEKHPCAWLEGTWRQKNPESGSGVLHEKWEYDANGVLTGIGYEVNGADTNWFEKFQVVLKNNEWLYQVNVPSQHGKLVLDFKIQPGGNEDSIVFSNPNNDFPSEIVYVKVNENENRIYLISTMGSQPMQSMYEMIRL